MPCQIFIHMDKIPLSLLFSRLNSPISLSLFLCDRYSLPLIIFKTLCWTHCPCLSCTGEPSIGCLGYKLRPLESIHIVHQKIIKRGGIWTRASQLPTLTARPCFLARLGDGSLLCLLFLAVMKMWLD